MWILLFRAFPFTTATPSFKVGLLRYKKVRRQVAALFFPFSFLLRFAPQKSEPYRAAIPYASKLAGKAGVQVLPNVGAGPTLLFWMNTLTTCAVSFQKTEN